MPYDQFHIPSTPEQLPTHHVSEATQPLLEALRIADAVQYTPEVQPEPFRYLKAIESRIDSYRETAIAVEARRIALPVTLRYLIGGAVGHIKSPLEKIVDKEAVVGGGIFQRPPQVVSQRFWYQGQHHGKGEWYYESVDAAKRTTVVHFQTTPTTIEKLVQGAPAAFTQGEAEVIALAPKLYERAVLDQLYPIDAVLQDDDEIKIDAAA